MPPADDGLMELLRRSLKLSPSEADTPASNNGVSAGTVVDPFGVATAPLTRTG